MATTTICMILRILPIFMHLTLAQEQSFLREPFDQIATVGEHVTLPCRVVNKVGVLQWTRDDFGLGATRDLDGFKRYKMTGDNEEGDYTLDINPVMLEDDALFQCQVGASEGVKPIRSRYATLTVLVPPEPPHIFPEKADFKTVEGNEVELRCESRGGKPASEITWFDGDNTVIDTGIQTVQELMEDEKRYKTISTLKFVASREDHGKNITCQAQNSANRKPHATSIRLQIHFPPHVSLKSNKKQLLEGDKLRLSCLANANPDKMTYSWFVGGKTIQEDSSELIIDSVDRRLHNHVVRCEVTNPIGRTEASTVLDVSYSPVFLNRPDNVAGILNERITMSCKVDSNPQPTYNWYHSDHPDHVISHSSNLTFMVKETTVGEYVCNARVPGYSDISATASVFLKGPPKISSQNRIQYAPEGSGAKVMCKAFSVPEAQMIEWSYKGQVILPGVLGSEKYSVLETTKVDGIESTLIIRNAQSEDFGGYLCSVKNDFGADSTVIHLRKQTSMPLLVIVSGVLGGIILTVAIIMIMILCRRNLPCLGFLNRNSKKENTSKTPDKTLMSKTFIPSSNGVSSGDSTGSNEEKVTTSDGLSNNSSELKVEMRTSSSLSEEHCWERGSDSSSFGHSKANHQMRHTDYVDGLSRPFEAKGFTKNPPSGSFYDIGSQNVISSNYSNVLNPYLSGGTSTSSAKRSPTSQYTRPGELDQQQSRFSVHVRNSPISPAGSQFSNNGISVKNYSYFPPSSSSGNSNNNNVSMDYVPASAFCNTQDDLQPMFRYSAAGNNIDNYSVYVNGPSSGQHEVVIPSVHQLPRGKVATTLTSSSSMAATGSLATHV